MGFGNKDSTLFKIGICLIFMGNLVACQSGMVSYAGKTVNTKDRIELLEGGPHQGSWEARDIFVEFQYSRKPQDLKISGLIKLQEHLLTMSWLKSFHLMLHFVAADSKVMADQKLLKAVSNLKKVPPAVRFQADLNIPPEAAAIAFSYRGWAKEGPRSEDWEFWKMP